EVRNLDARDLRGVDQVQVLRHLDRAAVEGDRERVLGRRRRSSRRGRGGLRGGGAHTTAAPALRPTGHRLCSTWYLYSSRNFVTDESGGAIAASANTQIVMPLAIWLQMRSSSVMSSSRPCPSSIRVSTL